MPDVIEPLLREGRVESQLSPDLRRVSAAVLGNADPGSNGAVALRRHGFQVSAGKDDGAGLG